MSTKHTPGREALLPKVPHPIASLDRKWLAIVLSGSACISTNGDDPTEVLRRTVRELVEEGRIPMRDCWDAFRCQNDEARAEAVAMVARSYARGVLSTLDAKATGSAS